MQPYETDGAYSDDCKDFVDNTYRPWWTNLYEDDGTPRSQPLSGDAGPPPKPPQPK